MQHPETCQDDVDVQVRRVDRHYMFKSAVSSVPDEAVLIRPGRLHRASHFTQGARFALRVHIIVQNIGITRHDGSIVRHAMSSETHRKTVSFVLWERSRGSVRHILKRRTLDMESVRGKTECTRDQSTERMRKDAT